MADHVNEPVRAMPCPDSNHRPSDFRTTHWSLVLEAGGAAETDRQAALEELCEQYWYPLYAFLRRRGHAHADAQDLVQGFFAQLLARNHLASVHPDKGRFRTFLLTALRHYVVNDWERSNAQKRGGGKLFVALDEAGDEGRERYDHDASGIESADGLYDRAWAEQMLRKVLARLRAEHNTPEDRTRLEGLQECLLGASTTVPYAQLAANLGLSEAGVKSAVHRLRRRFRDLFREEIARTVARREEIDMELRYLVEIMTR